MTRFILRIGIQSGSPGGTGGVYPLLNWVGLTVDISAAAPESLLYSLFSGHRPLPFGRVWATGLRFFLES